MYYERVMKPLVTGATGFIGQQLCKSLRAPNVLTRRPETVPGRPRQRCLSGGTHQRGTAH